MEGPVRWHRQLLDCRGIWIEVGGGVGAGGNRSKQTWGTPAWYKNNVMDSPQWPLAPVAGGQEKKKKKTKTGKQEKSQDKQSATSLGRLLP